MSDQYIALPAEPWLVQPAEKEGRLETITRGFGKGCGLEPHTNQKNKK